MDLYKWLICAKQNGHEDRVIALINEDTKIAYKIITNDLYSRDWTYMVPTVPNKSVYYQISYLLRDIDKKLLGGYYVTEVIIEKNPAPFINGICYHVMVKEMALANQLKMETDANILCDDYWLKCKKEGDNGDMVTLYDWLIREKAQGDEDRRVTLMYTDSIFKNKKACIKPKPYGYSGHYISTIIDEKRPKYYTIDYLLRFIERELLCSYYVTCEGLVKDPYSTNNHMAYKLEVSDKIYVKSSNSHYGIDPISKEDCNLFKEYLNTIYGTGMKGEKHMKIKKVVCNGPATVIFWKDGTKTVVKCDKDDVPDYEKGILYAALKKLCDKKEYDNILRVIDAYGEFNTLYPELFPDHAEVEKPEKPKKIVYKRRFGDSDQNCPNCGQNWIWTQGRRKSFFHDGFVNITCRNCGHKYKYIKGGRYENQ